VEPTYRVLLVDDQPMFLELAQVSLEVEPRLQVVGTATSGEEALAVAPELNPDLVLVDVFMDGLNGFQVAQRLRVQRADLCVVIISAEGYPEHPALAQQVGANAFLDKRDIKPKVLLSILGSCQTAAP
jgi:two-component system nitrate/nitrite response regulator NarL